MVSELVDALRALIRRSHIKHSRVVLTSDLCKHEEGVEVGPHFIDVGRVEDRLDAVEVEPDKVILRRELIDIPPLLYDEAL